MCTKFAICLESSIHSNFVPGAALMKIVEVYKEIQDQQMNIVSIHNQNSQRLFF